MTNKSYDLSSLTTASTPIGKVTHGTTERGLSGGGNWTSASAPYDEPHSYSKHRYYSFMPLVPCEKVVWVFDHWVRPPNSSKVPVYRKEIRRGLVGTPESFGAWYYPSWLASLDVESRLDAKLAAKIRDAAASLIVTAGEAGETIYMLRDAARRLSGFCWSLYKKQWSKAARHLFPRVPHRTIRYHARKMRHMYREDQHRLSYSKTILEYEFGWRPLVKDIEDCQDALNSVLFRPLPLKVKAKIRTEFCLEAPNYKMGTNKGVRTDRKTLWLQAPISRMAQAGVTFPDVITALYNLIPFSFMVDWAWNLNAYLDSWATKQQVVPLYNQRSSMMEWRMSGFNYCGPKVDDQWYPVSDGGASVHYFTYDRGKPRPGWELTLPPLQLPKLLEFRHLSDTLAIFRERFRNITFKS